MIEDSDARVDVVTGDKRERDKRKRSRVNRGVDYYSKGGSGEGRFILHFDAIDHLRDLFCKLKIILSTYSRRGSHAQNT